MRLQSQLYYQPTFSCCGYRPFGRFWESGKACRGMKMCAVLSDVRGDETIRQRTLRYDAADGFGDFRDMLAYGDISCLKATRTL